MRVCFCVLVCEIVRFLVRMSGRVFGSEVRQGFGFCQLRTGSVGVFFLWDSTGGFSRGFSFGIRKNGRGWLGLLEVAFIRAFEGGQGGG